MPLFKKKTETAILLLIGDLVIFYIGLFFTLILRYSGDFGISVLAKHSAPFFYVHILWLTIFYINGMYEIRLFAARKNAFEKVGKSMFVAGILAIVIFYLIPSFKITPKTNLLLDIIIVFTLLVVWRRIFWFVSLKTAKIKILFYGMSKEVDDFAKFIKNNPQTGYETAFVIENPNSRDEEDKLYDIIKNKNIQTVVFLDDAIKNKFSLKKLYGILPLGVNISNFPEFYETIMEKIPVSLINEHWFLANINESNKKLNEFFKRFFDVFFSIFLGILTLIITIPVAITVKITRGEAFYLQKRVGKNSEVFNVIKFGSMFLNAEKNGAEWAKKNDPRITKLGGFLRKTRIDELPQLWNVLKGEMSFIGPRPERPEFVLQLEKKIPHYAIRHLIKPGLSGWAQIKFPYGASVEDAIQKLQYDLYYIKNRSLFFDIAISLKTFAIIARREGI